MGNVSIVKAVKLRVKEIEYLIPGPILMVEPGFNKYLTDL